MIPHTTLENAAVKFGIWFDFFEFSDVSQSIHKDGFWQSLMYVAFECAILKLDI